MRRPSPIALGLLVLLGLPGCKPDRCRSAEPAFELDLTLPSAVTTLQLSIGAAGLQKQQILDVTGKLAGGKTSVAVTVGPAGVKGFVAEISVAALDAQRRTLATAHGEFVGTGDACNFFSLATTATDAAVDAPRPDRGGPDRPAQAEFGQKDGSRSERGPRELGHVDVKPSPDAKPSLDKVGLDGQKPDGPALVVTWQNTGVCPKGNLVGAGGDCSPAGALASLAPAATGTVTVDCMNSAAVVWAACRGTFAGALNASWSMGSAAICPAAYPRAVGGGCDCLGGAVKLSFPSYNPGSSDLWSCGCGALNTPTAYVICTDAPTTVTSCQASSCNACTTIIGGGCECAGTPDSLVASEPVVSTGGVATFWKCQCSGSVKATYLICAQ